MIAEASITGLFRMLLMIVGAVVLLRFIGRLMQARRNADAERQMIEREKELARLKRESQANRGKIRISKPDPSESSTAYTDWEEV